jgi:hypothetical protein
MSWLFKLSISNVSYVLKEYIPTNSIPAVRNDKNHGIPIAMLNKNIMNISNSFISRFIFYTSLIVNFLLKIYCCWLLVVKIFLSEKSLLVKPKFVCCWLGVRICFTNSQLFVVSWLLLVIECKAFWLFVVGKIKGKCLNPSPVSQGLP